MSSAEKQGQSGQMQGDGVNGAYTQGLNGGYAQGQTRAPLAPIPSVGQQTASGLAPVRESIDGGSGVRQSTDSKRVHKIAPL